MRRVAVDGCASNLLLKAEALTDHTRGRIFPEELARSQGRSQPALLYRTVTVSAIPLAARVTLSQTVRTSKSAWSTAVTMYHRY